MSIRRIHVVAAASIMSLSLLAGIVVGKSRDQVTSQAQPSATVSVATVQPSIDSASITPPSTPLPASSSGVASTTEAVIRSQTVRFEQIYFSLAASDTAASKMAQLSPNVRPIIAHECNCYVTVPADTSSIGRIRKAESTSVVVLPLASGDFRISFASSVRAQVALVVRQQTTVYPGTSRQVSTLNPVLTCAIGLVHSRTTWLVDAVTC